MTARRTLLRDLVGLRRPTAEVVADLAAFAWDSEVELIFLTRVDALRAVKADLDRAISSSELVSWADALEVRDDVGLEPGVEDLLRDFLSDCSTPEALRPMTPEVAQAWRARLQAGSESSASAL